MFYSFIKESRNTVLLPLQVTVLQPETWRRIQNSLSGYNEEKERLQAKMKEREELHTFSKDSVKHWENTIEVCCFNFYFPTNAADQTVKSIFRRKNFIRLPSYVYLAGATHIRFTVTSPTSHFVPVSPLLR